MNMMEKDIEFGRNQILNYKDETMKLRDAKKVLMSTLKKAGIEVPPSLLISNKTGGGNEPISEKELEEMTSKITKSNNKGGKGSVFNVAHSGLDPTQNYQNNDKVLY